MWVEFEGDLVVQNLTEGELLQESNIVDFINVYGNDMNKIVSTLVSIKSKNHRVPVKLVTAIPFKTIPPNLLGYFDEYENTETNVHTIKVASWVNV